MSEEIYKCDECDECGDRFLRFTIDPNDALDFVHIIQLDGVICKGYIYMLLMKHYREKYLI